MKLNDLINMDSGLKIVKRKGELRGEKMLSKNQILLKIRVIVKEGITRDKSNDDIVNHIERFLELYSIDDAGLNDKVEIFMKDYCQ